MIKCCDSITVWKTWKDHANIFDIAYAIMNNMENLNFDKESYLHIS